VETVEEDCAALEAEVGLELDGTELDPDTVALLETLEEELPTEDD